MFTNAESYALAQTWIPRYLPPGSFPQKSSRCAVHATHFGQQSEEPILIEWMFLPRPWQVAIWGDVLDNGRVWLCPNVWHTAVARAEEMRERHEGLEPWSEGRIHGSEERPTIEGLAWTAVYNWRRAINGKSINQITAPTACEPEKWRCSICGGKMTYQLRQFSHVCNSQAFSEAQALSRLAHPAGSGRYGSGMARGLPLGGAERGSGLPVPARGSGTSETLSEFGPVILDQVNERLAEVGLRWDGVLVSRSVDARA